MVLYRGTDADVERIVIFANPISGRGRGAAIARRLEKRLRADGYDVSTITDPPETLGPAELNREAGAAIVIGGDGTLRAVADRLFLATPDIPTDPPLLVVPLGTANLMGRHLGIRWSERRLEDQIAAAVRRRRVVRLDTARANGRLFLLMTGVGFDAHVVHEMNRLRRGPITYASYLIPAALAIADYRYPPLRVSVDGRGVFDLGPAVAFVGNIPEYGTGFPILPHARPDDDLLDVCVLPCRSPADLARFFILAAAGEHLTAEGVVYTKGRHVRIESAEGDPVPVQVDGDPAGHTPVEIDLLPVRLPFIVP